ncbi:MAG TPA: ribosome silencing factor [Thermoanaerobaculia bacterium]|nr:ribosome silencing factor [Thermoanaerobaculia bacterium]
MTTQSSQQDPQKSSQRVTGEEIARRVREAVTAADDRKAVELKVLDLAKVTDFTDYFLICSGTSDRQVQAIADAVDERLRAEKVRPLHREGMSTGHWVLLDYGDFIVHVFDEETRRFYGLERLWSDAPEVTERFREAS